MKWKNYRAMLQSMTVQNERKKINQKRVAFMDYK